MLVLLPATDAANTSGIGFHHAPFQGTPHLGTVVITAGCGGTAAFTVTPTFNVTKGIGLFSSKATSKGCGPPGLPDQGTIQAIVGLDSTTFLWTKTTPYNISFNFTEKYVVNLSATPMPATGGPFAWAAFATSEISAIWDLTTGTFANHFYVATAGTTNGTTSGFSNATGLGTATVTLMPANFTNGHRYFVEMYLVATLWTYAPSGTTMFATAKLNSGSGGHSFRTNSWTIYK